MRCGVSDFALSVAGELESAFGIQTAFAVLNSQERCAIRYPIVYCMPGEVLDACVSLSKGGPAALLVHLSGYGYSQDGAPADLANAIVGVSASGRFRITVLFHELFAWGMPWRSAFWHSRRQREVLRRIASSCDLLVTSTQPSLAWLEKVPNKRSAVPVQLLPIFSQVGEPHEPVLFAQRQPVGVVFGLATTRQRAYKEMAGLGSMLRDLGIEELWDIGPEIATPRELSGIPIRFLGVLPAEQVSERLSQARFGFLPFFSAWLTKSTVLAAYCAHGTIPVLARNLSGEIAGLRDGLQLLSPQSVNTAPGSGLEQCSHAAWSWYQGHRLRVHASMYASWIEGSASGLGPDAEVPAAMKAE